MADKFGCHGLSRAPDWERLYVSGWAPIRACCSCRALSVGYRRSPRDVFGHLSEVPGGCGEEDLVAGAAEAPEPQAVELEDALEVGKFDLLPLAP